jgi:hypothetical protein
MHPVPVMLSLCHSWLTCGNGYVRLACSFAIRFKPLERKRGCTRASAGKVATHIEKPSVSSPVFESRGIAGGFSFKNICRML